MVIWKWNQLWLFNLTRLSFKLWSFHQNDKRFKDDAKGNQCKCNALVYSAMNFGINNQALVDLDSYLNICDHAYRTTVGQ